MLGQGQYRKRTAILSSDIITDADVVLLSH